MNSCGWLLPILATFTHAGCSSPNPACVDQQTHGIVLLLGESTEKPICSATLKSTPSVPISRNSECRYVAPTAGPGTYDVTIEAAGYKTTITKVVLVDDGCGAKQKSGGFIVLEPL